VRPDIYRVAEIGKGFLAFMAKSAQVPDTAEDVEWVVTNQKALKTNSV
jgi:hypothetical protein